jgi:glycosyltransferase involved in cell wall biosynthesis
MKIAYLSTFYPFRGGIAQFNASLFREFEKNNEARAYTFSRQYPDILFPGSSQYVTEDDKVDKIDAEKILDSVNPFSYQSAAGKIAQFAPEAMLMKFWLPFFGPSLGWVAKQLNKQGCKSIAILDNVIPHEKRPGDIAFTKFFLKQCSGFVVMSETVKKDLLSLKPDAKYIYQPHPLYDHFGDKADKLTAREKLGIKPDKKILLFFGFIRKYKGVDLLIETLKQLDDSYELIIAGEVYGEFKEYDELIDKLGIASRIYKHVRYISDDEVPLFFSASDACVLPYKSATQSGIVGISYHFDLPVIATDVGGLSEMVVTHNTGIMAEEATIESIKTAIENYFENENYSKYIENIAKLKDLSSWNSLSNAIIEFAKELRK